MYLLQVPSLRKLKIIHDFYYMNQYLLIRQVSTEYLDVY